MVQGKELIDKDRSVIVACDVPFVDFEDLVNATYDVPGISGYKVGPQASLGRGLSAITDIVHEAAKSGPVPTVIYDHQKAGNDIPNFGIQLMEELKVSSVDGVILFPFAGPVTQEAWIKAAFECELVPIVGGEMTHQKFLASQGGYIADDAPERIYRLAAQLGVKDFVVPGTKPDKVAKYKSVLEEELGSGNFTLYAPGFISQGGDITEVGKIAGDKFHAIVGSAIYGADDMHRAAITVTSQLESK